MNQIAKFYTIFWIVYFPVCIAFTVIVNFDWSDEILTGILLIYAFIQQRYLIKENKRNREIGICASAFLFYLIYSLVIGVTTKRGVWLDIFQQARPYLVFYLTWLLAPDFNSKQKKMIRNVTLLSFGIYVILFVFFPSKINPYGGLGAFSGGESAIMGQLALCCAMIYYLFSPPTRRNRSITLGIVFLGLLCGKSKYFGECVAFVALVIYVKNKLKFNSSKIVFQVTVLAAVVIFFTWTKFNAYYVEGFEEGAQEMARPMTYRTSLRILTDYFPFGSGFGTFGCAAAAKEYSPLYYTYHLNHIWGLTPDNPMFLADAFYPIYPAQFGIVGIILFLIFWKKRIKEANAIPNIIYYRMALMCILALALESTADSSYLSGKGMGYFMILALCLNSGRLKQTI